MLKKFKRQKNREGEWLIDYNQLREVDDNMLKVSGSPYLEEIELVILALSDLGYVEIEPPEDNT